MRKYCPSVHHGSDGLTLAFTSLARELVRELANEFLGQSIDLALCSNRTGIRS